ncbi:MAG TPA: hypothetical protein VH253_16485 [Phycisphaerae bacterium]|nr:hypothetical protein [Phycisphaerae bacterium]
MGALREFAGNPFGVLGLGPGATQGEVDRAARRMRVMIGPEAAAAAGKGSAERARMAVERAVAQLADPLERVRARVWWLGDGRGKRAEMVQAVMGLVRNRKAGGRRIGRWTRALARAEAVAADGAVLAELQQQERAGEFEKAATAAEVAAALGEVPGRVAESFAQRACERMLDADDPRVALRAAEVLGRFGPGEAARRELLVRMEDYLTRGFDQWKQRVHQAWLSRQISFMRPMCDGALRVHRKKFAPVMAALERHGATEDQMYRIRAAAAGYLDYLSQAYEGMYRYGTARRVAGRAASAAHGTARAWDLDQRWKRLKRERWRFRPRPTAARRRRSWQGWGVAVGIAIGARTLALFLASPGQTEDLTPPAISLPPPPQVQPHVTPPDIQEYQRWLDAGAGRPTTGP